MNEEIWKDIDGFEGYYQVSNLGRVKSVERVVPHNYSKQLTIKPKIIKLGTNSRGYANCKLSKDGKVYTLYVHRLIAEAFIPNPNNFKVVNHKDGNSLNNSIDNLEWVTQKQNIRHALASGLLATKLSVEDVISIRQRRSTPQKVLAEEFNICQSQVSAIQLKKQWKDV